MALLHLVVTDFLRQPPLLIGVFALIGLYLQKKKINEIIKGASLAAFGVLILTEGIEIIINSILPIQEAVSTLLTGDEVRAAKMQVKILKEYGSAVGVVMFGAFLINIFVARFTKIKHIFLTGHMLFWFSYVFVAVAVENGFSRVFVIVFATIIAAIYFITIPAILTPFVTQITGERSFTIGHSAGFLAIIAAVVARLVKKLVGNKNKSTEDINLPESFGFFRESAITGGLIIFLVFFIVGLWLGEDSFHSGSELSLFTYSLTSGLKFGSGLTIMLLGVRMMIQEIIPAFKGISDKLVPNSIPALDCAIIFPYRPNAVIIGFFISVVTSTIAIVIINTQMNLGFLMLPLVLTSFFEGGTAAVLADGQGGLYGAIVGTAVASIFMVLFLAISLKVFQTTIADWLLIFGGNDFSIFGFVANKIATLF